MRSIVGYSGEGEETSHVIFQLTKRKHGVTPGSTDRLLSDPPGYQKKTFATLDAAPKPVTEFARQRGLREACLALHRRSLPVHLPPTPGKASETNDKRQARWGYSSLREAIGSSAAARRAGR